MIDCYCFSKIGKAGLILGCYRFKFKKWLDMNTSCIKQVSYGSISGLGLELGFEMG